MKTARSALRVLLFFLVPVSAAASGPLGIYGIVEKVVFEPSETAPERIQVFGAFAFVDDGNATEATRGYLYFTLPEDKSQQAAARTEWSDLKAVAGTGQAVAFGRYLYIGGFDGLRTGSPNGSPPRSQPPYALRPVSGGGAAANLWVHPESAPPADPVLYSTDSGIVKLSPNGTHAAIVSQLRQALRR